MVWTVLLCLLWMAVSLFLILIILLQRGKGGGLVGALGGVGGSSAFGTKAGDVFTRITIGVFAVYLLLAMIGVWSMKTKQQFAGAKNVPAKTESADDKKGGDPKKGKDGTALGTGTKSDDSEIPLPPIFGKDAKSTSPTDETKDSGKDIVPPPPLKKADAKSDASNPAPTEMSKKGPAPTEPKDTKKSEAPKAEEPKKSDPPKATEKGADQKSPSKGAGDSKDGKK